MFGTCDEAAKLQPISPSRGREPRDTQSGTGSVWIEKGVERGHGEPETREATIEAVEEAIVHALVAAETMTGLNGRTVVALPHDPVRQALRTFNRLTPPGD
jgi:hypothetical protein